VNRDAEAAVDEHISEEHLAEAVWAFAYGPDAAGGNVNGLDGSNPDRPRLRGLGADVLVDRPAQAAEREVMRCNVCGSKVELGSAVLKDCDGCIAAYLNLRQQAKAEGKTPPPLAVWAKRRAWGLGLKAD
jgi:hypothetical protein